MIDPRVVLALVLVSVVFYGGKAVVHGTTVAAKKTVQVVSHPFRHPKKDVKAAAHAITHPKLIQKDQ